MRRLGDFNLNVVAGLTALQRQHAIAGQRLILRARQFGLRRWGVTVGADANDIGRSPAVEEVAVHRVREIRAFEEAAERLRKLAPVGDQCGRVRGAFLGEADESGGRGANAFNGA